MLSEFQLNFFKWQIGFYAEKLGRSLFFFWNGNYNKDVLILEGGKEMIGLALCTYGT